MHTLAADLKKEIDQGDGDLVRVGGARMQEVVRNRRLCCVRLIQRASAPPSALDAEKSREFALFVLSLDRRKAVLLRS